MGDVQGLIGRMEALLPGIEQRAAEGEALRRLPHETIEELDAAGVFRAMVSPERGGLGLGLDGVLAIGATLGRADTATAWVGTFLAMHSWLISMLSPSVVDRAFGSRGYALAPAALSPTGTAEVVEGGYRVTGRWAWGSGCMHADHALVTAVIDDGRGGLDLRMVLLRIDEVTIDDVWHTDGLRGTGSNDVVVDGVVVPADRTVSFLELTEGGVAAVPGTPMAGYPLIPVLALTAASPLVGGARGAFEAYRALLAERVLAYTLGERQAEKPSAQMRLARVDSQIRAAELLLRGCADTLDRTHGGGRPLAREERSSLRLDVAMAVQMARRAVAELCEAAGGSAHMLDQPLQRFHRDLDTGSAHAVFDLDRAAETHGRILVGLPAAPTDML